MTIQEVADRLIELLKAADYPTIYQELFSTEAISIEPEGTPWGTVKGLDEIARKGKEFGEMVESFHGSEFSTPIVADHFIALTMKTSITWKGASQPTIIEEICVYNVVNGKIISEEFFYTPEPSPKS